MAENAGSLVVENLEQKDVAAIFYTSGTTGFPKGAMTTHEGFLSNIETCRRVSLLPFDGSMRTLVSVPLFHVTGCNSQFLVACEGGSATVIMPVFNVQSFLKLIEAERINTLTDESEKQQARQAINRQTRELVLDTERRHLLRALYSPGQLREQMTWFWMNHFSVYAAKG